MKRIAVCGEIYSANLGDQAIHACLLHLLKRIDPSIETISLDLSGRTGLHTGFQEKPGLRQQIAGWQSIPFMNPAYAAANAVYQTVRLKRVYAGPWGQQLRQVHSLVIGGGQLLMDDGLNFPLKVAGAADQAHRLGLPIHFSACGVGRSWSTMGKRLFSNALSTAASITLRDHLSSQHLEQNLPGIQHKVTFDPAIWAADVYPALSKNNPADFIGLCVIHQDAYNARSLQGRTHAKAWMQNWLNLISALLDTNKPILLFSTGSPADQRFADALFRQACQRGFRGVELAAWPSDVADLLNTMHRCGVVISTRLHAAVLANAYGIATIGMVWDEKVRAYYEETGRSELCFDLPFLDLNEMVRTVQELHGQAFPASVMNELRQRALRSAQVILTEHS
jgi:polysaccharide pyruvyl transferase WcaK-like protein